MQTVLEEIAHFVSTTTYEQLPEKVISTAILGLTDYSACALAGACAPVSENVLVYLEANGLKKGCCSLFGTSVRTDVKSAGFFNGVSSHSMDFDDVSWATIGHPSVSTAPAVFACGQAGGWDGKKTLLAYVLAIETMHQIAALTMPKLSERGWHTTLTYGVFGAVIPAALLLGLSKEELIYALGIAASRSGGIRANFGTQTKALHAGLANRIGIDSAQLASFGITSSASAIEGQDGLAHCFTGEDIHGKVYLGKKWDLEENGLVIKRYPCCSGSHPTNDVWDEFLKERPLAADQIERIEAGVSLLSPKELTCHLPQDCVQAKFSLEFALACRLIKGSIKLSSFTDANVRDPEIQAFMKKIEMKVSPELAKLGFIGTAPVRLKIRLKNGEEIFLSNDLALGNPEKPLSTDMVHQKFLDCSARAVSQDRAEAWFQILQKLPQAASYEILSLGAVV